MALPESISKEINTIVVIPVFREDNWKATALSLLNTVSTEKPAAVFWLVNENEAAETQWKVFAEDCAKEMNQFFSDNSVRHLQNFFHLEFFPSKTSGVGLARKTGMDKACDLLLKNNLFKAPIVCLDADCTVSSNYFIEIEKALLENPKAPGASLYYEHPLTGMNAEAIAHYEYFLRYYNSALRWCGHPFAFHTVGSSMLVRTEVYKKQGGMNKRKAGEDFYFLNKIIELGNFIEINNLCVFPSNRNSDRVPFGTGRAMEDFQNNAKDLFYDERIFHCLKDFFDAMKTYPKKDEWKQNANSLVMEFLISENRVSEIDEVYLHSADQQSFLKRFFRVFNLFTTLKCVHFLSEKYFPRSNDFNVTKWLMDELSLSFGTEIVQNLETLRKFERRI